MKNIILFATIALTSCIAPTESELSQLLCTPADQDAGICYTNAWRIGQTRQYGRDHIGSTATPLNGGCALDGIGIQCYVSFAWGGSTYTVICGFQGDTDDTPSCSIT